MGLLDDLKKQAELVKAQQRETSLTAETIGLVDGRMKQAFAYLNDLLNQFKVLKPQNPLTYVLPGVGELKNLGFEDTFIDYREKNPRQGLLRHHPAVRALAGRRAADG